MDTAQAAAYRDLAGRLTQELKQALAKRDTTLLGVVLNVLLILAGLLLPVGNGGDCIRARATPWRSFRSVQRAGGDASKERELIEICKQEKGEGRKTLVYLVLLYRHAATPRRV